MKRTALAALLLLPASRGLADIADLIKARLSPFHNLHGHFEQSKDIRILHKPLKSRGDFILVKGQGVLWRTSYPIAATLRVSPTEIVQLKDGKVTFRLKNEDQPALKLVGQVLFAVFAADLEGLHQHFGISGSSTAESWKATLLPKEPWVAKVATKITLQGDKTLQSLEIDEANGDRTVIRFSAIHLDQGLSAPEKMLFE